MALSKLYFVKIPANTKEKLGQVFVHMGGGRRGPTCSTLHPGNPRYSMV